MVLETQACSFIILWFPGLPELVVRGPHSWGVGISVRGHMSPMLFREVPE